MKLRFTFFSLFLALFIYAQTAPAYYNGVNFSKTRNDLKEDLVSLITRTHTNKTTYDELRQLLPKSDADPQNPKNMLLIYGYSDSSGKYQRSRASSPVSNWNREHVFAKSQASPNLGTAGPGADGHHLRPADISFNSERSNIHFTDGRGNAGKTGGGWYPGDEWKGDVARILMYMYLRYGNQCAPDRIAMGTSTYSSDIPDVLIKWNVEDPVSDFERQRNNVVADFQGNRNPFIDNPYLATVIWGGPAAQNTWPSSFNGGGEADTEKPSTPTDLKTTAVEANSVSLSWTASTDNNGIGAYDVYVNNVYNTTSYSNSATVNGLNPATTYSFYVVAKDFSGNESDNSLAIEATTKDGSNPNPGNPDPGQGTSCGTEDFENMPNANSSYTQREWTNRGITWKATDARTDQTMDGRAIIIRNGSLTSSTITSGIGSLSVRLSLIYSGTSGTFTLKVNGVEKGKLAYSADAKTVEINDINVEGNVIIELTNDSTSNRVLMDNVSWTCYEKELGTDDLSNNKNTLTVYPNPITNSEFYIKGLEKNETIDIYNLSGQLVQTIRNVNTDSKVRLNKLPKGVYIVKTKKQSTKVIIN
ncbi:Por secretion system C-terminal sorting domain-containing protein [Chishuiella changwenlii]|uniref:Por secretion system C-terminal sorting domain-containing protein n=1 Tax=Chishuiella changwenlii TaxID=1434701 RepID=A0A1M6V2Y8_9FLAO|nr:endonuclease [Chishuiella changwenlii]GGF01948.1 hypothetical protein GCM10010984_19310 [Chishuiella changwenlii]SHK75869.1 Por secretion system C-terminal sorting domain-containing protein [Chishuiella changwenlii]